MILPGFRKLIIAVSSLAMGMVLVGPMPVHAGGATLVFAPGAITMTPGGQNSTALQVQSDVAVNSVDVTISFPAGLVSVVKVDTSGTDFPSMFMGPPQVDNSAGTVHFLQSRVGGTTGGTLGLITFQAKSSGNGSLGIKAAKVIANDGKGTDVYSGSAGGTIAVSNQPAPTPPPAQQQTSQPQQTTTQQTFKPTSTVAPQISSTTHPDQNKWYATRSASITWSAPGAKAFNYAFDRSDSTQLPETSMGPATSASTTFNDDGVWYAHVKAQYDSGWSATSHFKLQVDSVEPPDFDVVLDPSGTMVVMPKATFAATDATSGIDHFEARLDNGGWSTVFSPYQVPKTAVGDHTLQIKAVDKAGNTKISQETFTIKAPDAPVITSPSNQQLFMLGQTVKVTGKADPNVSVDIYLNGDKKGTVLADETGKFVMEKGLMLFAGAYKVVAKAVSPDGFVSPPSAPISLTIDARAVKLGAFVMPGWVFFTGAIILILSLLVVVGVLLYRLWRLSKAWAMRVGWMRTKVHDDLEQIEARVDAKVDELLAENIGQAQEVKTEVASVVAEAEIHLDNLQKQMLEPEPWLPILHGKERFGEAAPGAPLPTPSINSDGPKSQQNAPASHGPAPDAMVVYGRQAAESKNPEAQESKEKASDQSRDDPSPQSQSGQNPQQPTTPSDPMATITADPKSVAATKSVDSLGGSASDNAAGDQSQSTQQLQNAQPVTAPPMQNSAKEAPVAEKPAPSPANEEKVISDAVGKVDLFAPKISNASNQK